jgi:hypothetical protein
MLPLLYPRKGSISCLPRRRRRRTLTKRSCECCSLACLLFSFLSSKGKTKAPAKKAKSLFIDDEAIEDNEDDSESVDHGADDSEVEVVDR